MPDSVLRQRPLEVARDTFVIRETMPSIANTFTNLNSMVIRAAEPVLVDTGMVTNRETWFEDVFSLVNPEEVRWIFVTHIDTDHSGNLVEALARCPGAMMVTSRGESYRASASLGIPFERMRMIEAGDDWHVGDRVLRASRPPVYDSPYTRALHDASTGVYYAADAFCAPMPEGVVDWSDEIAPVLWSRGLTSFHHHTVCPWIGMVEPARFRAEVDKLAALDPQVIVSAHAPPIGKAAVPRALDLLACLPSALPVALEQAGAG
ncbi:MAG: MBL fold metallo-hydrolase [Novosphingobium sp.]